MGGPNGFQSAVGWHESLERHGHQDGGQTSACSEGNTATKDELQTRFVSLKKGGSIAQKVTTRLNALRCQPHDAIGTYRAKSNRRRSEADKSPISSMRLVNCIGIVIAQLLENIVYSLIVLGRDKVSYDFL